MSTPQEIWRADECPRSLIEAVLTHSILYTLGYDLKKEVFVIIHKSGVFVQLRAEGLIANIRVGTPELSLEEMASKWEKLLLAWNTGGTITTKEKDQLMERSKAKILAPRIATTLAEHGFKRLFDSNSKPWKRN